MEEPTDSPTTDTTADTDAEVASEGNLSFATPSQAAGAALSTPEEIEQAVDLVRSTGRGTVRIERINERGETSGIGRWTADAFDVWTFMAEYGPGRYRILCGESGKPGARARRILIVGGKPVAAAPPAAAATAPVQQAMPTSAAAPGMIFLQGAAPQPSPVPPPTDIGAILPAMLTMMSNQAKQQGDMLIALLTHRAQAESQQTPVSQLTELLKVAQGIARFKGGNDGESNDSMGGMLAGLGAAFANAMQSKPAPVNASVPMRVLRPVAPPPATPAPDRAPSPAPPPAAADAGSGDAPAVPDARLDTLVRLFRLTAGDAERDPVSFANVAASMLGDSLAGVFNYPAPFLTTQLVEHVPDLAAQEPFIREVEAELRDIFQDEPGERDADEKPAPPQ